MFDIVVSLTSKQSTQMRVRVSVCARARAACYYISFTKRTRDM